MVIKHKISVILPVHNCEKYIGLSIESIVNQTFTDFELLIINDGSTDSSSTIIDNYAKNDTRIKVINNKKNLGLIKSLNMGLEKASGKYIARMDADDICDPKRLEVQYNFLENQDDIFLCGTYSINIDGNGNTHSLFRPPTDYKGIIKLLAFDNPFRHSSIIFRNGLGIKYRSKMWYTEDYDLYLRCVNQSKIMANIPQFLIKYRIGSSSISFSKRGKQILFADKAREFYQQRCNYNSDKYGSFNPKDILNQNIEDSTNLKVIESEIKSGLSCSNLERAKYFGLRYIKIEGFKTKITIWILFFISFIDVRIYNILIKIYHRLR